MNFSLLSSKWVSGKVTPAALQRAFFLLLYGSHLKQVNFYVLKPLIYAPQRDNTNANSQKSQDSLSLLSSPITKFCIGFNPFGNSQIRFTYFKQKVAVTKDRSRLILGIKPAT